MGERCVMVDGKVRTDQNYPAGFMDVVEMPKSNDRFRLLYDTKGRYVLCRLDREEAQIKLCRINKVFVGANKVPCAVTHDGRTLRYPDPDIKVNDTVKLSIASGKATDIFKFGLGAMIIITVKDSKGNTFATRLGNVFVIGNGQKPEVSLPKGRGIKKTILQERDEAVTAGRI